MASPNQQYHGATFKPHKHFAANSPFFVKKTNLYTLALLLFLCTFSYLFGVWRHEGGGGVLSVNKISAATATTNTIVSIPCNPSKATTAATRGGKPLDFSSHHKADDLDFTLTSEVKSYPSCNVNFSEYTPCEDAKRSLRFKRHQLIYRERHCPEKHEILKCRIPAPHGYKNPFKWPASRDFAWYNNVPHKHLTVEKAGQNWIRFAGDRFRFPGGGTMFPNGADAYIDDIGRLINLKDGSIRTAIDTGCGVIKLLILNLYTYFTFFYDFFSLSLLN
jgi:hypothetical protein